MKVLLLLLFNFSFLYSYSLNNFSYKDIAKGYYKLGVLYWDGVMTEKNYEKANNYFNYACQNNISMACKNIGLSYENGLGIEINKEKAMDFYSLACKDNEKTSCYNLGLLYFLYKNDEDKAAYLLDKSCNLGYKNACKYSKFFDK